jgi:hypothetical protein
MNDKVKYVENQGRNSECMHVKCKYVVMVVWNKYHFYQHKKKIRSVLIHKIKTQRVAKNKKRYPIILKNTPICTKS